MANEFSLLIIQTANLPGKTGGEMRQHLAWLCWEDTKFSGGGEGMRGETEEMRETGKGADREDPTCGKDERQTSVF